MSKGRTASATGVHDQAADRLGMQPVRRHAPGAQPAPASSSRVAVRSPRAGRRPGRRHDANPIRRGSPAARPPLRHAERASLPRTADGAALAMKRPAVWCRCPAGRPPPPGGAAWQRRSAWSNSSAVKDGRSPGRTATGPSGSADNDRSPCRIAEFSPDPWAQHGAHAGSSPRAGRRRPDPRASPAHRRQSLRRTLPRRCRAPSPAPAGDAAADRA